MIQVEVIMAWPHRYQRIHLQLPHGATVAHAVCAAAIPDRGDAVATAIFGRLVTPEQELAQGDRVELLRPLLCDPQQARRRRAIAQQRLRSMAGHAQR